MTSGITISNATILAGSNASGRAHHHAIVQKMSIKEHLFLIDQL